MKVIEWREWEVLFASLSMATGMLIVNYAGPIRDS
jgi:hypothetical protein